MTICFFLNKFGQLQIVYTFYTFHYLPLLQKHVLEKKRKPWLLLRGIDNSNFLIDSEQLEFFQQQMMLGITNKLQLAGAWKVAIWSWGYPKSLHDTERSGVTSRFLHFLVNVNDLEIKRIKTYPNRRFFEWR